MPLTLHELPPAAAATYHALLQQAPLAMHDGEHGTWRPIPASLSLVVVDDAFWDAVVTDAHAILAAMRRLFSWLRRENLLDPNVLADLTPYERAAGADAGCTDLATVRLDLYFDGDDLRVLEVNTTIPAMQAYSDMILQAWARAAHDGGTLPELPSNADELLDSLLAHYHQAGGTETLPALAIAAREGDAQLAELLWLRARWRERGHAVELATPQEFTFAADRLALANGAPLDLIYRHVFVHRLPADSALALALRDSRRHRIWNPVCAHLEAKAFLAELSRTAEDDAAAAAVGYTAEERAAVRRRIPWSRILRPGPALGPNGEALTDLPRWLHEQRLRVVLKASTGYGGNRVVLGSRWEVDEVQEQVRRIAGAERAPSWPAFVDLCASGRLGTYIVQLAVPGRTLQHRWLDGDGEEREGTTWIDCSVFANHGVAFRPRGAVVRFATSPIVNLGRGGGLMPVLTRRDARAVVGLSAVTGTPATR